MSLDSRRARTGLILAVLLFAAVVLALACGPVQAQTSFTPLVKGFTWTIATQGAGGVALAPGETESTVTVGIRLDGDTSHSSGSYQYLATAIAGQTSMTPAQLLTALGKALPPGNYWAALDQTDVLSGAVATSAWTGEVPFSIPYPIVPPAAPAAFTAS